MNKLRRKELSAIIAKMEELENLRQEISEQLEAVKDEEAEALGNLPESLQDGERGQQMQEYIEAMENVLDDLDIIDVDDLTGQLQDIVEG